MTIEAFALQAVALSLEPQEAGGEIKLNLSALEEADTAPSPSLPAVRTSITAVSPRQSVRPASSDTSEIQPALPDSQQVRPTPKLDFLAVTHSLLLLAAILKLAAKSLH